MVMELTFLGTGAAVPTKQRNLTSILFSYKGEKILFDCGEGTQKTLMTNSLGLMKINQIFITHWHVDHTSGLQGLLATMGLEGRTEPLEIIGPGGTNTYMDHLLKAGHAGVNYPVLVKEVKESDIIIPKNTSSFFIVPFSTKHRCQSLGYAIQEKDERKANREKMQKLKLPSSPLIKKLKAGKPIEINGKTIKPEEVIDRVPGRKIIITGDTEYSETIVEFSKHADILIHDSTFLSTHPKAELHSHATAADAARTAKKANVKKLYLTHISRRYQTMENEFLKEARAIFPDTEISKDLLTISLKPIRPEEK